MQMYKRMGIVAVCVGAVVLAGCGKKENPKQSAQPSRPGQAAKSPAPAANATPAMPSAQDFEKMAEQNRQALAQMNQGKTIEAVPAATLKDLLPADLPGMKRTDASGEKVQSMGVDLSTAEGQYNAAEGGDSSVRLKIMDAGNMSGPMRMGMTSWALAQYSRETDTGYEKTTTYNGYKAFEKYTTADKRGTVRVLVADRFIVEIEGNGVTMDTLKQMLGKIDLKKLAAAGS